MRRTNHIILVAIALIATLTVPAVAGTEYEIEIQDHRKNTVETTLVQADGLNLKMGVPKQGRKKPGGAVIFKGDRREGLEPRLIMMDDQGGHMVINQAKIDQIAKMMPPGGAPVMKPEMMAAARAQIEKIQDPEQRAMALENFERRFGSADGSPAGARNVEWVERGLRDKNGYPAVRYDMMRDGVKVREVWATDWANIEGGRQTSKAFEAFGEFYRGMRESLEKVSGMAPGMFGDDNPFESIFELDRFPVATYEYDSSGQVVRSSILKSGKKVEHEPGTFKPGPESVERQFMQ